jgi:uncharacterized protein YbjT (DUF2867 family)
VAMVRRDVVTGSFGYTGRYITQRLLAAGRRVATLTNRSPDDNPFGDQVPALPFHFDAPEKLQESLRGADTLYNTYWIRFPHRRVTFDAAVENSRILIRAAEAADIERIVHVSITNPSADSPLPYFRGKALVEQALRESKLSYAIVRPTVIFGPEDILINNIAWLLRRMPVFGLFGRGDYRVQPVFVEDFAEIAVDAGQCRDNVVIDAVGPDVYSYVTMVHLIRDAIGSRARIVPVPPRAAWLVGQCVGRFVGDVIITRDEIEGLMSGLLVSNAAPTGRTSLADWLAHRADTVGRTYASELKRHYR